MTEWIDESTEDEELHRWQSAHITIMLMKPYSKWLAECSLSCPLADSGRARLIETKTESLGLAKLRIMDFLRRTFEEALSELPISGDCRADG